MTSKTRQKPAAPRERKRQVERRQEAREKILDAAEQLFSRNGFHGVTIKEVAQLAGVDAALLHYYFVNKPTLFDAVFERRAEIANQVRFDAMERYVREAGDARTVEGLINAFLGPIFELVIEGGDGWRSYGALVAQVNNSPELGGGIMRTHFDPVAKELVRLLHQLMPDATEEDLYWGYHFLSGAFTYSLAQTGRVDRLSDGLCCSTDMQAINQRMAPLFAAGIAEICKRGFGQGKKAAKSPSTKPAKKPTKTPTKMPSGRTRRRAA